MNTAPAVLAVVVTTCCSVCVGEPKTSYVIVDTGQIRCYDDHTEIAYPKPGEAFFGQDAQYEGAQPCYRDNGDGTIADVNTGLMWEADPGDKQTYAQAVAGARTCRTAGYDDWRLPTIKELYSLILFSGTDPDPMSRDASSQKPFIDTRFFKFRYGDPDDGDRIIDSQWATSTRYVSTTMNGAATMFGVNFADGRIKGYPCETNPRGRTKKFFVIYVRGNPQYGKNSFVDNGDGTITDRATGLTWMQTDSIALQAGPRDDGKLEWREALEWAEGLEYAGCDDWRLPTAKELQSIVDYTRSPDTTQSAAIDPIFTVTPIKNEGGRKDFGCYWSSTSHTSATSAESAAYVAFGRALGYMGPPFESRGGPKRLLDVHGAGAQRSDPKQGDLSRLPDSRGPQGDIVRVYNVVRCVRGGDVRRRDNGPKVEMKYVPRRRAGDGPPDGAGFIRRLDRDNDGRVSREEFDGPKEHFRDFDTNGDGYIDSDEAPTGPPAGRGKR